MNNQIEVRVNKRQMMVFDDMDECNQFVDSFAADFKNNVIMGAPKETHEDYVEISEIFYNPRETVSDSQEVVLLDIHMPKGM